MNDLTTLNLDGKLDIGDVLAVVTSRAEARLHQELEVAKGRLKEAEANLKSLQEEISKKRDQDTAAVCEAAAAKLRPGIVELGGSVVVSKVMYDCDGQILREIKVRSDRQTLAFTMKIDPSPELVAMCDQATREFDAIKVLQGAAVEARKRLANVPMLERKARARLAEHKLSETEDGRRVLDLLTVDLESDILALSVN